ncbi:MAG: hypothetical protein ACXVB9_05140 [Bdellovibrionota bacterium]
MRFLLLALLPLPVFGACPKNKKEWQAKGPKIFVEKAARQHAPITIEDFSAKIGGKSTTSSAVLFHEKKNEFVMVQAKDNDTSLFLTGILKCDTLTHEPVLLTLSYVKGDKSGLVPVVAQ